MIKSIFAISENGVIGKDNALPWPKLKQDFKWFYENTKNNVVIMGRSTWESLGKFAPLSDRINYVVSKNCSYQGAGCINGNIIQSIKNIEQLYPDKVIWIIGGKMLYELTAPIVDEFYVTYINKSYDGDTIMDLDWMVANRAKVVVDTILATDKTPSYEFQIWK
jgi:dihydrofolate reductase